MSDTLWPHGLYSPWNSPGQNTGVGSQPFPSAGDLPKPGIKPSSPTLQLDSSPAEALENSKNTGVGSLSHLQCIFPTQELNQGLLHCKWILYQLSYQLIVEGICKFDLKLSCGYYDQANAINEENLWVFFFFIKANIKRKKGKIFLSPAPEITPVVLTKKTMYH